MISEKMQSALNGQIKFEIASSYLYLSMAAYLQREKVEGIAHWMHMQSKEEMGHAMKLYNFIIESGGTVELLALGKPKTKWTSVTEVFADTLKHEQLVTGKIDALAKLAAEEGDAASADLLQWFAGEQVEEESSATKILDTLKRIGEKGPEFVALDRELAGRE